MHSGGNSIVLQCTQLVTQSMRMDIVFTWIFAVFEKCVSMYKSTRRTTNATK